MTALIDGELPPARARQVQSHIESCFPCTEELTAMREAAELVSAHHRKLEPHPTAWRTLQARLSNPATVPQNGWLTLLVTRWRPAMAIVLIGFGSAIGMLSYQRHVEARRELESYMARYVQTRAAEEQSHRQTGVKFTRPDSRRSDNPFLMIHQTAQDNPFRR